MPNAAAAAHIVALHCSYRWFLSILVRSSCISYACKHSIQAHIAHISLCFSSLRLRIVNIPSSWTVALFPSTKRAIYSTSGSVAEGPYILSLQQNIFLIEFAECNYLFLSFCNPRKRNFKRKFLLIFFLFCFICVLLLFCLYLFCCMPAVCCFLSEKQQQQQLRTTTHLSAQWCAVERTTNCCRSCNDFVCARQQQWIGSEFAARNLISNCFCECRMGKGRKIFVLEIEISMTKSKA